PGQILDEIKRRLVRPVEVFDHQDGGRGAQLLEHRGEERRAVRIPLEQRTNRGGELLGDIVKGAKRSWSEQRLTGAPETPYPNRGTRDEAFEKRGLADAGLASDQGDVTLAADALLQQHGERSQLVVALEQA